LRGDLDTIALKALEKDRARRYATPAELAADLPEAETLQRDALRLRTRLFGPDSPVVGASLTDLAITLRHENKLPEAEAALRKCLDIDLKNNRAVDAASDEHNLERGASFRKPSGGSRSYAAARARRSPAGFRPRDRRHSHLDESTRNVLQDEGKLPEAELYARNSLATIRRLEGDQHPDVAVGLNHVASLLRDEGKLDEAEPMFRQALEIGSRVWGPDQADMATIEANLGDLLAKRGKLQQSERLLRTALRSREKILPGNQPSIFDSAALLSARRGLDQTSNPRSPSKRLILREIVEMYTVWNRNAPEAEKAKLVAKWKAIESQPK
jgi:tetratricopeptide (TPR) repeat protein